MSQGHQERVFQSIASGHALVSEIAADTGLDPGTIANHVRRLRDAGRVQREYYDGKHLTRYVVARERCRLAEQWK